MNRKIRKFFIVGAYRSYGNLSRFFIRVFAGFMFMQFGIRQIANYDFFSSSFPDVFGMGSELTLVVMITIELLFSVLVIFGFCTRVAVIPPLVSMVVAEYYLLMRNDGLEVISCIPGTESALLASMQIGYVPIMFIGMFFFIVLAGPGKISVDYLVSLYFTNKNNLEELNL